MSVARSLSLLAGLAALTACTTGSVIYPTYIKPSYQPGEVSNAAAYGAVRLRVVGNPFASEQSVVDRGVAETMSGTYFGPNLNITPDDVPRSPYFFVVLFDPARNASQSRVCAEPDQPRASASGRLEMLMAFCNGPNRISSTVASLGRADSVDDPSFQRVLRNATATLVPPRREDQGDEFISD